VSYIEILILVFLCLIGVILTLWVGYLGIVRYRKANEETQDGSYDRSKNEELGHTMVRSAWITGLSAFVLVALLVPKMVFSAHGDIIEEKDSYWVMVTDDSMASVSSENADLTQARLADPVYRYDALVFSKDTSGLKTFDVVFYEDVGRVAIARYLGPDSQGQAILEKDALPQSKVSLPLAQILGIRTARKGFLSFLLYLGSSAAIYVMIGFLLADEALYLVLASKTRHLNR
jgi:hypothetical protein